MHAFFHTGQLNIHTVSDICNHNVLLFGQWAALLVLLGFKILAQRQLSGSSWARAELYLFPQLVLLSCWDLTAEVYSEWSSVCLRACCKVMIIWYSEEEPQAGNWQNEGFWELVTSVGFPCSSKEHNCVSLLSRWNEAMFVSCISYFSSWTECTLGLLSNLSLLYASAVFSLLLLSLSPLQP